jgi:phospholipid/cholesterol/gamma-HCH transport system substrate-binding protein
MRHDIRLSLRIGLGLTAITLVAGIATLGIRAALGAYATQYELTAVFPRSGQGLDTFSTVKIRGVTVGAVERIRLLPDGRAAVTLRIEDDVRIPDSVSAATEPLSVFGPKYINLVPGPHETSGPFLGDGDRIVRTTAATEITDVLSEAARLLEVVDPGELHTIIHTAAEGLRGLGAELGRIVDNGTTAASRVVAQDEEFRRLLDNLALIAGALESKGGTIADTTDDLNALLPAVSGSTDELGRILDATAQVSRDLAALVSAHAPALDDLLGNLSPAVDALYHQLSCIVPFLESNTRLMGILAHKLLSYQLPDGDWVGVVTGPFHFVALLLPPPLAPPPPIDLCRGTG